MKNSTLLLAGTALALLTTAATAQTFGDSAVDNRIENLQDDIADDFERDTGRFGNAGRSVGFDGSMALQASGSDGNTDTTDIGIGVNAGYYDGVNGYEVQLSYQYADDDGDVTEDSLLYELEYTRDLTSDLYGFAKLQGQFDSFDLSDGLGDAIDTSDNFFGVGLGYKVYNTRDIQWNVAAGVGYRVNNAADVIDDLDEAAVSLSSDYFNRITDQVFITNDTDIIASDGGAVYYNDLGVNVAMSETLALRASVVTEYNDSPSDGEEFTDNSYGLSLVYNFN